MANLKIKNLQKGFEGFSIIKGIDLEVNDKEFRGVFKSAPGREDVLPDINENLVVELYSK